LFRARKLKLKSARGGDYTGPVVARTIRPARAPGPPVRRVKWALARSGIVAAAQDPDEENAMEHDRKLTLHFNDGSKLAFEFPEQGPNAAAKQIKLNEFLTSRHVVIEAEGSILVFPISNIKYIQLNAFHSTPGKFPGLPKHTITGARIAG